MLALKHAWPTWEQAKTDRSVKCFKPKCCWALKGRLENADKITMKYGLALDIVKPLIQVHTDDRSGTANILPPILTVRWRLKIASRYPLTVFTAFAEEHRGSHSHYHLRNCRFRWFAADMNRLNVEYHTTWTTIEPSKVTRTEWNLDGKNWTLPTSSTSAPTGWTTESETLSSPPGRRETS